MTLFRRNDPTAMFQRAHDLWGRGKISRATAIYRRVIDSGDPDAAAEAGIKLAIMLKHEGDLTGAENAYRAVMDLDVPERAPVAAFLLTGVLQATGRYREAISVYKRVIASNHEDMAPKALLALAELFRYDLPPDERNLKRAAGLLQRAIDTGHPDTTPKAMVSLAELRATDNPKAAATLYQRAINSEHAEAAPVARQQLRELRAELGQDPDPQEDVPNQRLAVGDPGCFILQDEDGQVFGLWFEDAMSGDAYSADPTKVRKILVDNSLGSLLDATYSSYPDGDRGGYTIQFHRDNWHAPG